MQILQMENSENDVLYLRNSFFSFMGDDGLERILKQKYTKYGKTFLEILFV